MAPVDWRCRTCSWPQQTFIPLCPWTASYTASMTLADHVTIPLVTYSQASTLPTMSRTLAYHSMMSWMTTPTVTPMMASPLVPAQ